MDQVVILLINQVIQMKGLDHHLLCPYKAHEWCSDQWSPNVPWTHSQWDYVWQHIMNPFDATNPIFIPLKLSSAHSYFDVRKPTWEGYEDQNNLKKELMVEAPPWDLSSP